MTATSYAEFLAAKARAADVVLVRAATRDPDDPTAEIRWHTVAGEPSGPGLAVTPGIGHGAVFTGRWTVLHTPTGFAVSPGGRIGCARAFAARLVATGVDWTTAMDAMRPDGAEIRAAVVPHIEWFLRCPGSGCWR